MMDKKIKFIFLIFWLLCGCSPSIDNLAEIYKKVISNYEKKFIKNPDNLKLRLKLANFYYNFNDFIKARDLLIGIEKEEAKILLAKTFVKLKDYVSALDIFEKLGELDDQEYLYLYGEALEEQKLYPKAVKIYKKVKGFYKELAQQKIREIGIRVEEGIPKHIEELTKKYSNFISKINKEDAVIILVDEEIEIKDNTAVSSIYVIKKILKEKGKSLAEVEINYDSTYEKVELEYARTITPSGKIIYAGKENIRDVSKYLNFPLYSNARAFIISMPSVDVGSIIEYKAKIYSSKLVNKDDFTFIYRLRESYPIAEANFKLIVLKNRDIKLKFFNENYAKDISLSPLIEEVEDKKVYLWKFKEIFPIIPEANMPPTAELNPGILISSFSSWDEVYNWWYNLYKDKIVLDEEMKKFLSNLIRDCKTDLEKIKKIYEFCTRDIRYVAVEYGDSGYEPHSAIDIFWNRYGDCKDKAILLISLLREANFDAYPVLIPTRGMYQIDEEYPSINFNHAICAVSYQGRLIFMDATASTTSFFDLPLDDQERKVLVFFDDHYKILTTPLITKNEIIYNSIINIKENGDAYFRRVVKASGYFAASQRYYFKNTHPDIIKEGLEQRISTISPHSELIDYNIENIENFDESPILKYTFKAKKFLNSAKNLRIIPLLEDINIDVSYIGKEDRNYPLEFYGIFKEISKIKIYIPKNLEVKYLPEKKNISTEWFDFSSLYRENKNAIECYQEFVVKKRIVSREEYKEFKKAMEEVLSILKERVILNEKKYSKKEEF